MKSIKPRKAVFDRNYVKLLDGKHVKKGKNKFDLAKQLRADIRDFKKKSKADRLVMIWCASTETFTKQSAVHQSLDAFETRTEGERSQHRAVNDLRLCGADGGRSVCQWRAEPYGGYSGDDGAFQGQQCANRRQRFQDRPDADEDHSGARLSRRACWA